MRYFHKCLMNLFRNLAYLEGYHWASNRLDRRAERSFGLDIARRLSCPFPGWGVPSFYKDLLRACIFRLSGQLSAANTYCLRKPFNIDEGYHYLSTTWGEQAY